MESSNSDIEIGSLMRKWFSNVNEVLLEVPCEEREFVSEIKMEDILKPLGIGSLPIANQLFFTISKFEKDTVITKRIFLSQAAKLFYPLGWLGPVAMKPKLMFQRLWKEKLGWDDELSTQLTQEWKSVRDKLNCLEDVRIPRWFGFKSNGYKTELHGFSDAAEGGFGAVIYIKSMNEMGNSNVELVLAKSRVAPVKKISIPRSELCGAVLLANIIDLVRAELKVETIWCWTQR